MSGRVGAVHLADYELCIRKDERERVVAEFEKDVAKWRSYAPTFHVTIDKETVLLCAQQVDHVIARIRSRK